jgi:hypothetical protein
VTDLAVDFENGFDSIQFVSRVNLIQMWLIKVIYILKNISNERFQYCLESKLIEVMKMKIHPIQFVPIVNLILTQTLTKGWPLITKRVTLNIHGK